VALARYAHQRWSEGARVLIRCQAGVNRSGLVMALTLMHHGHSAAEAIALIRSRRSPAVLSNRHFVRWLLTEAPAHVPAALSIPSSSAPTAA
jgi:protein-tyrosine phosphatase